MVGIEQRSGSFRIVFRYRGKKHRFTLGEVSSDEAETKARQVDYLLMRLKQRLAAVPPGVDIVDYVQFDGKQEATTPARTTLAQLRNNYTVTHKSSLEANTLATAEMHFRHRTKKLGETFPIGELKLADLQGYVDKGTRDKWHDRAICAETIRKEVKTLRTGWN